MIRVMRFHPHDLPPEAEDFLAERHLATLTTLRASGAPHVVPVGFTYDSEVGLVRIITRAGSQKVRNIEAHPGRRAVVCQVDGARWMSFEGPAEVSDTSERIDEAVDRYSLRYRAPGDRADRVVIEISVDRITGSLPAETDHPRNTTPR
jgi:PPOX class probable F420-dependent enzyme